MCDIKEEVGAVDFHDQRLNTRCQTILSRFAEAPQTSIPVACRGWSETDAAYKFFAHPRVTANRILAPHHKRTRERCGLHPVVLVVQDTTELDYTHGGLTIEGLGVLDHRGRRGMHLHVNAAFSPEGCCLGVLGAEFIVRSPETIGQARQRSQLPIADKESQRWLTGYEQACALRKELIVTQVVSIADCEADIYELLVAGQLNDGSRRRKADWIIRARHDRSLPERMQGQGAWCYQKLRATLESQPEQFRYEIELQRTPKRAARQAVLVVRATTVTLKPPPRRGEKLPPVTLNVVLVEEIDPPADVEPVDWMLLTCLPIDAPDQIRQVIEYYTHRWPIEPFFRTLKTGCKIEDLRLESIDRLQPCIAMYMIVAWRVMFVTMLGRECGDMPADVLFADQEWRSTWQVVRKEPPPASPPSLSEFIKLLASLGGYLGRRRDPPPGPKAIWIGIRRMTDFAHAWLAFGPGHDSKPP
jgi:Transposase DNA-binding/Transposase Tn5 dimerisation domain